MYIYIYYICMYVCIYIQIFTPYTKCKYIKNFITYINNYVVFLFAILNIFFLVTACIWNEPIPECIPEFPLCKGQSFCVSNPVLIDFRGSVLSGTLIRKCARTERNLVNAIDTRTKLKRDSLTLSIEGPSLGVLNYLLSTLKLLTSRNVIERVSRNFETTISCCKKKNYPYFFLFAI